MDNGKLIAVAVVLALSLFLVAGCLGGSDNATEEEQENELEEENKTVDNGEEDKDIIISSCKQAASQCNLKKEAELNASCSFCEEQCIYENGSEVFQGAIECCEMGKPDEVYEGSEGCQVIEPNETDVNETDENGYETTLSACKVIEDPGKYELNQDFSSDSTCIKVKSDNVLIDGGEHRINGPGITREFGAVYHHGVEIKEQSNVTVQNFEIRNFDNAFKVINCSGITIRNNTVTESGDGVELQGTSGSKVFNNQVIDNDFVGISLSSSSNNQVISNRVRNCSSGVYLEESSNNNDLMKNNLCESCHEGVLSCGDIYIGADSTGNEGNNTCDLEGGAEPPSRDVSKGNSIICYTC